MKLKSSLVKITPKKAEELLKLNTYAGQRNISPTHVQALAEKMEDGRFNCGRVAVIVNGNTVLADGQHQCSASILSGRTFPALMLEHIVEEGDTKQDIAEAFAQYNTDRSRSRADIAWIYGAQAGMAEWPRQAVSLCNSALGWIAAGFGVGGSGALDKDANARLLAAKKSSCQFILEMTFRGEGAPFRHLQRMAVAAAMIVTHGVDRCAAEEFWAGVRDGELLRKSDPRSVLRDALLRGVVRRSTGSDSQSYSQRELYAKCIHGWNAWRSGKSTSLKFYANKPLPRAV